MPTFMPQIEAIPQVPQAFTLTWAEELRTKGRTPRETFTSE